MRLSSDEVRQDLGNPNPTASTLRNRGKFRHKDESKDSTMRTEAESGVVPSISQEIPGRGQNGSADFWPI